MFGSLASLIKPRICTVHISKHLCCVLSLVFCLFILVSSRSLQFSNLCCCTSCLAASCVTCLISSKQSCCQMDFVYGRLWLFVYLSLKANWQTAKAAERFTNGAAEKFCQRRRPTIIRDLYCMFSRSTVTFFCPGFWFEGGCGQKGCFCSSCTSKTRERRKGRQRGTRTERPVWARGDVWF